MIDTLNYLYNEIYYFKATKKYIDDVDIVYSYIENFSREESIVCANFYLQKYQTTLRELGKQSGGVQLVYDNNIYKEKTDADIIDDLIFCIWGILCAAHIYIGFCKNVNDFVIKYLTR